MVAERIARQMGIMTGLIGMSGGVGGFYLASSLGYSKQFTGSYRAGFLVFALLAATRLVCISGIARRWRSTWSEAYGAAGV